MIIVDKEAFERRDVELLCYIVNDLKIFNVKGLNSITKIKDSNSRMCIEYDYVDFQGKNCKCRSPWFLNNLYLSKLKFDKPYTEEELDKLYGEYFEEEMRKWR